MNKPKTQREGPGRTTERTRPRAATGLYLKSADGLRIRHRKVRRLVQKMRILMPWLEPSDIPCARAWAELELLGANVFAELITNGVSNDQVSRAPAHRTAAASADSTLVRTRTWADPGRQSSNQSRFLEFSTDRGSAFQHKCAVGPVFSPAFNENLMTLRKDILASLCRVRLISNV
jgi:hypothetical protein